ncbi:MAG: polyphosphate kinase 2 family protein [Candidatus Omnitrophica bacterium]|nr:polyphosphate kinase 2 family protein [Candidatus Omnitrophota bacterium]
MSIAIKDFRVEENSKVRLKDWPTQIKPFFRSDEDYQKQLAESKVKLSQLQDMFYAHDRYSLLIVFQAMDAAGKDSVIKHVMSGVNPQGCQVFSFKHPSVQELDHDFLWRTTLCLPERGRIGIFNRSYYEEVLIVKVHPSILTAQKLPKDGQKDKNFWKRRYQSIVDFEKHLDRNGTKVIKFFLHVSKQEQARRFLKRIEDADKNWKFSIDDMKERECWDDYMSAYEDCLSHTSTEKAPWFVVPADNKNNARLIVSSVIREALKGMKVSYPKIDEAQRKEILKLRDILAKESEDDLSKK